MNLLLCSLLVSVLVSSLFYLFSKNENNKNNKNDSKGQETITLFLTTLLSTFIIFSCFYGGSGKKSQTSVSLPSNESSLSHSVKAPF